MVRAILCLLVLVAAPAARAQRTPEKLREVETGFSAGSEFGALWFFGLPSDSSASASGALLGINVGGDLGPLRVGLLGWGQSLGAGADYRGIGGDADPHHARGDFQTMMVGLDLRLSVLSLSDSQGVSRTHVVVRALGGPTLSSPDGVLDRDGIMLGGGAGVLYHTRVRHFALGLDVLGLLHSQDAGDALGLAVLPSVRYTF